jgi:hypothetical protein
VIEVVPGRHFLGVPLRRHLELRVSLQRALAAARAFFVDQAQHRCLHTRQVPGVGRRVRVRAGSRGRGGSGAGTAQADRKGGEERDAKASHARVIGRVFLPQQFCKGS